MGIGVVVVWSLAVAGAAQTYRAEQLEALGFTHEVHRNLQRIPLRLDEHPEVKAIYATTRKDDELDVGAGPRAPWRVEVRAWSKAVVDKPLRLTDEELAKLSDEQKAMLEALAALNAMQAKTPAARIAVPAKGSNLAHTQWEYIDDPPPALSKGWDPQRPKNLCRVALYETETHQIEIRVVMPMARKADRLPEPAMTWSKHMAGSGRLARSVPRESDDASDVDRDQHASSPEQRAVLERVKASIAELKNWDYFTTERYVIVYSWNKGQSRGAARSYAARAARSLTACQELYGERFPPYQGFTMPYGVLRVCGDRETFLKYSTGAPAGVIGWYSRTSGELALFRERDDEIPRGSTEDVLYHEGWHQYSHAYFDCAMHPWFEEGLGDYFASFRRQEGKWRRQGLDLRKRSARALVAQRGFTLRNTLETWRYADGADYARAYAFVAFLNHGGESPGKWDDAWKTAFDDYWRTALQTKDAKAAYQATLGKLDLAPIQEAFVVWVKNHLK